MNMRPLSLPMPMPVLLLLLLFVLKGTVVKAGTHVNISIGHEAATNPADITYVDGKAPAELRAGPFHAQKHHSDFAYHAADQSAYGGGGGGGQVRYSHGTSARLTAGGDAAGYGLRKSSSASSVISSSSASAGSGHSAQLRQQNQEFERYIQNYHSGPTVETVFESAAPSSSSQRQKSLHSVTSSTSSSSSSSNNGHSARLVALGPRPAQVHSFERQVVLPSPTPQATLLPPTDDHQVHTIVQPSVSSSSSSSSSSSGGYDQSSGYDFHNKPSFGGYDGSDIQAPYAPPEVDDSHIGFGGSSAGSDFYAGHEQSNVHFSGGSTPSTGYLPSYPRPVITKTIQIAQPALKAKKFEIRHPAVQKEFYDIEERVLIKPAGTIVVELERPVAKIPKGETVLPLGHPHPAVASAYNTNGAAIVETSGSDVSTQNHNKQYSPSPVYNPHSSTSSSSSDSNYVGHAQLGGTTIGSTVTATPSFDTESKDDFVESNLNRQYNADAQYVSNDETDRRGTKYSSNSNRQYNNFASYGPQHYQQPDSDDSSQQDREYLSADFYNNQRDSKPARLQEQPKHAVAPTTTTHIIKHEHNIHLPASQHNIVLGQLKQEPTRTGSGGDSSAQLRTRSRYNEEAAEVLDLKPYLKHHNGPVVVYRPSTAVSTSFNGHYTQHQHQPNYEGARYATRPSSGQHNQQFYAVNNQQVKYSSPYTNMRYYSDQTPRYVYGGETKSNYIAGTVNTKSGSSAAAHPEAHIHINIPHHPKEATKPIIVTSKNRPVVHNVEGEISGNYHQHSTTSSLGGEHFGEYRNGQSAFDSGELAQHQQTSSRLVDADTVGGSSSSSSSSSSPSSSSSSSSSAVHHQQSGGSIDANFKSTAGHVAPPGSRVIASIPAQTDASSESFHKRRIAVNHPFQTVREVVEHEPITNYHHIQVNEPASPDLYQHTAPYYQQQQQQETHGALRHLETVPLVYHHTAQTHGNLHYAPAVPLVHLGYHHG